MQRSALVNHPRSKHNISYLLKSFFVRVGDLKSTAP
ncbi:hypothetical protein BOSE62_50271 [Bosea sp. 62]|nr:hypothetical protein BOSE21B_100283 [Bosea sp. 21B]CAD5284621.1 hypothetical protein BOSE7B_41248 [Bosea sp. 7B]CAD5301687.1 hypothetical protein BOSE46_90648 [Bosea sp. 46]VVT57808.1 hypothetical protein BOS5A_200282 [Bosea sp. EC-HK365B]VXB31814.1 hypothetical protein BOSE29B_100089 [Bosea sp. 29B]VXB75641.1 hypothetical protein BOSE125_150089 [Bosea sp. 125]VXC62841.1 hypothetical protein BOSE62_50271 [Bosea sp. 62]VXC91809.1 hypothetical protein BOSE127_80032 [Bosea sp. 127]